MLAVSGSLYVVRCVLFDALCSLFVGCVLFVFCWELLVVMWLVFVVCCLLLYVVSGLLFVVCCALCDLRCLSWVCSLLSVMCDVLFVDV